MKLSTAKTTKTKTVIDANAAPTSIDPKILPRVSIALTLNDLKEECKARAVKGYSALKKDELLQTLRAGSICISQMKEYKVLEEVKAIMKKEEMTGKETTMKQKNEELPSRQERFSHVLHFPCLLEDSSCVPNVFQPTTCRASTGVCDVCHGRGSKYCCTRHNWDICEKCASIDHTIPSIDLPKFHPHRLVESEKVLNPRQTALRSTSSTCNICRRNERIKYSCLSCDWDICSHCISSDVVKKDNIVVVPGSSHLRDIIESDEDDYPPLKRLRTTNTAKRASGRSQPRTKEQLEVSVHSALIKKPNKDINQNPKQLLKYVVWSSAGYPPDGWHSYEGEPKKEFDSSWNTILEANKRANYVFFHANIWGLPKEEIEERDYQERFDEKEGFVYYYVHPDDSEKYTVTVVHKEVFEYLSTAQKDDYNKGRYIKSYDSSPRTKQQREVSVHSALIKKPNKDINQNPKQLLKYVVWTSAGYPPDGWHSYEGEPKKEFDSSWNTILEANKRANYVFFHANIWGFSKNDMEEFDCRESFDEKEGFVNYYVHPDDSDEYTVAVVQKEVFEYLSKSQQDKYDYDSDSDFRNGRIAAF